MQHIIGVKFFYFFDVFRLVYILDDVVHYSVESVAIRRRNIELAICSRVGTVLSADSDFIGHAEEMDEEIAVNDLIKTDDVLDI
jgi:hypothetical protein